MSLYLLGAYEARGSLSIARGSGRDAPMGRIQIETPTPTARLEEVFGPPNLLHTYAKPVSRYVTAERRRGLSIVAALLSAGPTTVRRQELEILRDFWNTTEESAKLGCMDRLRALRMQDKT